MDQPNYLGPNPIHRAANPASSVIDLTSSDEEPNWRTILDYTPSRNARQVHERHDGSRFTGLGKVQDRSQSRPHGNSHVIKNKQISFTIASDDDDDEPVPLYHNQPHQDSNLPKTSKALPIEIPNPQPQMPHADPKPSCLANVTSVFPGICTDYVSSLYDTVSKLDDELIMHILDLVDKGTPYPKAKDKKVLKRKRILDEDEILAKNYNSVDRIVPVTASIHRRCIKTLLMWEFPTTPVIFIETTLAQNAYRLFSAYQILEETQRTFDPEHPSYNKVKHARRPDQHQMATLGDPNLMNELQQELQVARRIKDKAEEKRNAERQLLLAEEKNVARAKAEGTMGECGCCYNDCPLNRMVHCSSGDEHWFCRDCVKMMAETEIGKSKWELKCMSMDNCEAGFSMSERIKFLDENTRIALERNEQEASLRLAGIENLASCPFCPFAAEYPPVEVDREFRCQAEDCERISCRLCKLDSHTPRSCEEFARQNGLSIRRQIEEAMSSAMIRKCNKCNTPFVKEEGCNKMTCTRAGCGNVQCYVCSKSCAYNHFNVRSRGGKDGNCPLFESAQERHDQEVNKAEQEALAKVLADHPEYTAEDLKVKMSAKVKEDDLKRKSRDPRLNVHHREVRLAEGVFAALGNVGEALAGNLQMARRELQLQQEIRRELRENMLEQPVRPLPHAQGAGFVVPFSRQQPIPLINQGLGEEQRFNNPFVPIGNNFMQNFMQEEAPAYVQNRGAQNGAVMAAQNIAVQIGAAMPAGQNGAVQNVAMDIGQMLGMLQGAPLAGRKSQNGMVQNGEVPRYQPNDWNHVEVDHENAIANAISRTRQMALQQLQGPLVGQQANSGVGAGIGARAVQQPMGQQPLPGYNVPGYYRAAAYQDANEQEYWNPGFYQGYNILPGSQMPPAAYVPAPRVVQNSIPYFAPRQSAQPALQAEQGPPAQPVRPAQQVEQVQPRQIGRLSRRGRQAQPGPQELPARPAQQARQEQPAQAAQASGLTGPAGPPRVDAFGYYMANN